MKTIEQKAKAYDEALKWMRELYPGLHGATKEDAERYFSELRESEDERIRKALIDFYGVQCDMSDVNGVYAYEVVAWLEKQKEHTPAEWSEEDESILNNIIAYRYLNIDDWEWIKNLPKRFNLPPKQEWSEEDKRILKGIIGKIDHDQTYGVSKVEMLSFLKSLSAKIK